MVALQFVVGNEQGQELGFAHEFTDIDMDIGASNDFETRVNLTEENKEKYWYNHRLFVPGTEFGGIIKDIQILTESNEMVLRGPVWRGILNRDIIEPPEGETHLELNGDLNDAIRIIIGESFGSFFVVPNVSAGITINNWQVDRYVTCYKAITNLVETHGYKLQIKYIEPENTDCGYVEIQAVPIIDYSDEIEYSQESQINMNVRDYRDGVNHLICLGSGEGTERLVVHLYVQSDGNIGTEQYYYGLEEYTTIYDYSNAKDEIELINSGIARLKELQNYKQAELFIDDNAELEIGDIVSGYEVITDTQVKKHIIQKILKISDGVTTIEYNVKGDD